MTVLASILVFVGFKLCRPRVWLKVANIGMEQLFVFTVTLSAPSDVPVTVNYGTADRTAKAGEDYTAQTGSITFAPGETTKTISIVVKGDKKKENNEYFVINLTGAVGAYLLDGEGLGTILDDDRR